MHDENIPFVERHTAPIVLLILLLTATTGCALFGARTVAPPLPPTVQPEPPPPPLRVRSDTPIFLAWETAPKIIEAPAPAYPDSARQAGLEGKVVLVIVVDEQGRVLDAKVFRAEPPGVFEQAALEAVRKWRFEPALQRDKPIKVRLTQEVVFRLEKEPPPPPSGA